VRAAVKRALPTQAAAPESAARRGVVSHLALRSLSWRAVFQPRRRRTHLRQREGGRSSSCSTGITFCLFISSGGTKMGVGGDDPSFSAWLPACPPDLSFDAFFFHLAPLYNVSRCPFDVHTFEKLTAPLLCVYGIFCWS